MENRKLNVYISYSLANTDNSTFSEIKSALVRKGYQVTYYIENTTYSTHKLDGADLVLFIGDHCCDIDKTTSSYYLSKGQSTELERCIQKRKPFLFFEEYTEGELLISRLKTYYINDRNDWKKKYAVVYTYINDDGNASDIDEVIPELNIIKSGTEITVNRMIYLLLK